MQRHAGRQARAGARPWQRYGLVLGGDSLLWKRGAENVGERDRRLGARVVRNRRESDTVSISISISISAIGNNQDAPRIHGWMHGPTATAKQQPICRTFLPTSSADSPQFLSSSTVITPDRPLAAAHADLLRQSLPPRLIGETPPCC